MNTIAWGLIGASDIASTRMIRALRGEGHKVVGVASGNSGRARAFADANGLAFGTSDLDELLESDIDAVYISSTNDRHFRHALAAIAAGKHVLCEKPLALRVEDAEAMVRAAEDAGLLLAVNHHLPGNPLHRKVRDFVASGTIGQPVAARVDHAVLLPERLRGWRLGSSVPGSGVLLDITCHDASVLNPLLGRPTAVTALAVQQAAWNAGGQHDAAMTVIEYQGPDGRPILAQTHDAFTVAFNRTSLTVHGTEASVTVLDAMTQDTPGQILLTDVHGTREIDVDCSEDLYSIVVRNFADAVARRGRPTATGADGVLALCVALAAEESARTGRTVRFD
ncbi:Gfo/Idh/MocA family protein [Sinomonas sp. P10A9]|uniref:Gfo/Idh/MocA family protein n=1 Tax=Sinomonas puerhi TaxID=3238584 RepID=A0AB39L6I4_9MICC